MSTYLDPMNDAVQSVASTPSGAEVTLTGVPGNSGVLFRIHPGRTEDVLLVDGRGRKTLLLAAEGGDGEVLLGPYKGGHGPWSFQVPNGGSAQTVNFTVDRVVST